jgi:hypothetical protein
MTTTEVVDWKQEMERQAQAAAMMERPTGGKFVSLKGGVISYGGQPAKDNTMECVVLASCIERAVWPAFDPDAVSGPTCYAMGHDERLLIPHRDVKEPAATKCEGCPNDQWGTSQSGKGKACRVARRLALLPVAALDNEDSVLTDELYFVRIPTMSIPNWQQHVHLCNAVAKMPPHGVITSFTCRPDPKSMFRVHFSLKAKIAEKLLPAILKRRELLGDEGLMFGYSIPEPGEAKPEPAAAAAQPRKYARRAK